MPQQTNLNISPYYDDFDRTKNFHRVLFKPGFPVQARELTTMQSILQNQVEQFGSHIFKEGSVVVPGGITFDPEYFAVQLDGKHFIFIFYFMFFNELLPCFKFAIFPTNVAMIFIKKYSSVWN